MSIHNPSTDTENHLPLVVGVDLGGTQMRTAVLRGATLLSRVSSLTGEQSSPDLVIPRLFQAVEQALEEAKVSLEQIAGIGICAPGPLNYRTGVICAPPNLPEWDQVPMRDIFSERFQVPIFVENDANAAGLGEYMFGAGRGTRHMVYLTISTGIGGGIITDGQILEGTFGTAGELGHMTINWRGERCNCGNIGCLESITSGTAIARHANAAIADGQGDELLAFARAQGQAAPDQSSTTLRVTARTVAEAAEAGIPLACAIIDEAAEALGIGLVNILHIFNPEIVILGGGVAQMGARLLDPAKRLVEERTMRVPREAARIVLAELGPNVGLVGAGALIYHYQNIEK
ncbi:ROK family protein [Ktedonosporobacter rubrisoli]|uniref:ROK family protein n=1 Tax=Ktedonosporobacter rubrisoli TaxID=2509675 RepID=UPI0013EEE4DB|nr:ROK family protein [Ktedonosporobacter rubrisoli]